MVAMDEILINKMVHVQSAKTLMIKIKFKRAELISSVYHLSLACTSASKL